jgi:hypothetical protein
VDKFPWPFNEDDDDDDDDGRKKESKEITQPFERKLVERRFTDFL